MYAQALHVAAVQPQAAPGLHSCKASCARCIASRRVARATPMHREPSCRLCCCASGAHHTASREPHRCSASGVSCTAPRRGSKAVPLHREWLTLHRCTASGAAHAAPLHHERRALHSSTARSAPRAAAHAAPRAAAHVRIAHCTAAPRVAQPHKARGLLLGNWNGRG